MFLVSVMLELSPAQKILAYAAIARSLLNSQDRLQRIQAISLVIHVQQLITDACKDNLIDSKSLKEANTMVEEIMNRLRPQIEAKVSLVPSGDSLPLRNRTRKERPRDSPSPETTHVIMEKEMLMMAHDMRDAANVMHSTIKRDIHVLSMTADTQDANLSDTRNQNVNAKNIRSSKRLGFIVTIIMMLVSLFIFLALVPLILVT
jgi:hypothetical protein